MQQDSSSVLKRSSSVIIALPQGYTLDDFEGGESFFTEDIYNTCCECQKDIRIDQETYECFHCTAMVCGACQDPSNMKFCEKCTYASCQDHQDKEEELYECSHCNIKICRECQEPSNMKLCEKCTHASCQKHQDIVHECN